MSSPSRTNDLQAAHCPSLHPCMSISPCSDAERSTVCSSSTSISMPTGSNLPRCLSPICSAVLAGEATRGAALDVLGVELRALFVGHLVEQHVRALQRSHPAQVVERPQLLRVVQVEVRLRDHRLAVVPDEAHVLDHVGPVPAVVERLPLAGADPLAQ